MLTLEFRSFHAVARSGNITQAARLLGVSQPTVTTHLRQLEKRYGVELFHRLGKGLSLTPEGQRLLPQVENILHMATRIDFSLRDARDLRLGNLRVGATGPYYIMPCIRDFHASYPDIDIAFLQGNSREVLDDLLAYRLDAVSSSTLLQDERLRRRLLAEDSLKIVAPCGHPLAQRKQARLADLAPHTLLLREPGSMTRQTTLDALKTINVQPRKCIEIASREAIHWAIQNGLGCSLIPLREIPAHDACCVIDISDISLHMNEYVYYLREREHAHVLQAFLRHLDAHSRAPDTT